MPSTHKLTLGISMGDANGIGLEIILKSFEDKRMFDFFTPVLFAPKAVVQAQHDHFKLDCALYWVKRVQNIKRGKLNVIEIEAPSFSQAFGTISAESGALAVASLKEATQALKNGDIDALVTAPIHKQAIQSDEFTFPGHTNYLSHALDGKALMFMISDSLRIALLTDHIPLQQVAQTLNETLLSQKINQLLASLQQDFGITKPKIALLGLNPHNGDRGVIGEEDDTIIRPTLARFQQEGHLVFGPYAADSFFGAATHTGFDAVLAIYHDQGLIPFKTLSFGKGVNFTAGLNRVRTSPDHGTAFEIAGQGIADSSSFVEALFAAKNIGLQRQAEQQDAD